MREPILVTGAAGFIGFHLARRLLADGWTVHGVDNLNDYYDPRLKQARLAELRTSANFHFEKCDLADRSAVAALFAKQRFSYVAHLAAQAGVAHSAVDPAAYVDANLVGFANILEGCRNGECRHLVYASSSSVYGANQRMPLRVSDRVDEPLSLYGATKRANELMAYSYAHLFGLPATGLRFFTVYGPWGRPDMAVWLFTQAIFEDRPVRLYNHGHMRRDFTYVDDVIEAMVRLIEAHVAMIVEPHRLILEDCLGEQPHRHVRAAPRPINREKAQARRRQAEQMCIGIGHELVGALGRAVEAQRLVDPVGDSQRHALVGTVHGG